VCVLYPSVTKRAEGYAALLSIVVYRYVFDLSMSCWRDIGAEDPKHLEGGNQLEDGLWVGRPGLVGQFDKFGDLSKLDRTGPGLR
jgi:hypothetical protein